MVIDSYMVKFVLVNLVFFGVIIGAAMYLSDRYDEYARWCEGAGGVVLKSSAGYVCIKAERITG